MRVGKFLGSIALLASITLLSACSTTGRYSEFLGATEQRLVTHSIDRVMAALPEDDFAPFKQQKFYLSSYFIKESELLTYATQRLKLELMAQHQIKFVDEVEQADKIMYVFFNALGADKDKFGLHTPDILIPGSVGVVSIDFLSLAMFHGVSELSYYILEPDLQLVKEGDTLKATVKTDKLKLPFITIPLQTLD